MGKRGRFKVRDGFLRIGARMFTRAGFRWYELNQLRDDNAPPVRTASSVSEIVTRLSAGARYESDKLGGKLDVLTHPRIVQRHIDAGLPIGDCEDHAGYVLSCGLKSGLFRRAWMGSIQMRSVDSGEHFGHAVSVWQENSNDKAENHLVIPGRLFTMDYADPRPAMYETWDWVRVYEQRFNAYAIEASVASVRLRVDDGLDFYAFRSKGFHR